MSEKIAHILANAIEYERSGNLEQALETYDQAILEDIEDVLIFSNRGLILERLQKWEDAYNSFSKAASISPNFRDHFRAGNMLLILKRYEEAINAFSNSLNYRDDDPECWVNKGIAHYNLEQNNEANNCFQKALKLDPHFAPALRSCAILCSSQGNETDAADFYGKAARAQPDRASAWFEFGCSLYNSLPENHVQFEPNGPEGKTIQVLDKVIELQPDTQGAWGRKIGVLFRLADAALAADRNASQQNNNAPALFPMLQGELHSTLSEACKRFPDDPWFADRMKEGEAL